MINVTSNIDAALPHGTSPLGLPCLLQISFHHNLNPDFPYGIDRYNLGPSERVGSRPKGWETGLVLLVSQCLGRQAEETPMGSNLSRLTSVKYRERASKTPSPGCLLQFFGTTKGDFPLVLIQTALSESSVRSYPFGGSADFWNKGSG